MPKQIYLVHLRGSESPLRFFTFEYAMKYYLTTESAYMVGAYPT